MVYLSLAIWGAVHPMIWFLNWFGEHGFSIAGLFAAWFENAAVRGLAWDVIIAGVALVVWVIAETRVRHNWSALWAIPATVLIGVSCGLPLYLFLRTRPV